jgi:hypothetical protein
MTASVFDAYAAIVQRIDTQVPAFALVDSPSVVMCEDDVLKKLPGCYVMPGPAKPTDGGNEGNAGKLKAEDQDWIVLITIGYPKAVRAEPETALGQLVLGVIDALNKWQPTGSGGFIKYQQRSAVEYDEGYASIRLRFTHRQTTPAP